MSATVVEVAEPETKIVLTMKELFICIKKSFLNSSFTKTIEDDLVSGRLITLDKACCYTIVLGILDRSVRDHKTTPRTSHR